MAHKRPGRFLIGLTGNIGTGKSTLARLLAARGAHVIDADRVAHDVMRRPIVRDAIVRAFGSHVLGDDEIDRRALGAVVFGDAERLAELELIVHPEVGREIDREIAADRAPVVVVEAIKLFESGLHRSFDEIWVVTSPASVQVARLVRSRGLTEPEARTRMDAQPPQAEKARRADVVIENSGSEEDLARRVDLEWKRIQAALAGKPDARGEER